MAWDYPGVKVHGLLFAFVVGGLGFEFCVFVAGWRHALRSEWPFIIIIKVHGPGCIIAIFFLLILRSRVYAFHYLIL